MRMWILQGPLQCLLHPHAPRQRLLAKRTSGFQRPKGPTDRRAQRRLDEHMAQGSGHGYRRQGRGRGELEHLPGQSLPETARSSSRRFLVAGRWGLSTSRGKIHSMLIDGPLGEPREFANRLFDEWMPHRSRKMNRPHMRKTYLWDTRVLLARGLMLAISIQL